jgi:hypothetical protein
MNKRKPQSLILASYRKKDVKLKLHVGKEIIRRRLLTIKIILYEIVSLFFIYF